MNKQKLISQVTSILEKNGFTQEDYIFSLQGPTLILAATGNDKLNNNLELKTKLTDLIIIL